MKIQLKKNILIWVGVLIAIMGIVLIITCCVIIDTYGGPGIDLTQTRPEIAYPALLLGFAGITVFMAGVFVFIYGILNKNLYHARIGGKTIKKVGVIKLRHKSSSLKKEFIINNLLSNGYKEYQSLFYIVKKGIAQIFAIEEIDESKIQYKLNTIRKEKFFIGAVVLKVGFVDYIKNSDIEIMVDMNENSSFKRDHGICMMDGIFEISTQRLYTSSKIFMKSVSGKMSYLYIVDMIRSMEKTIEKTQNKTYIKKNVTLTSNSYVIAKSRVLYWMLLLISLIGLFFVFAGFGGMLANEFGLGISILIFGMAWFILFVRYARFFGRTTVILNGIITQKKFLKKALIIDASKAKWMTRGVYFQNGIIAVLVIATDYGFKSNELVNYKTSKNKYIIMKDTDRNRKILEKVVGEETKI